MQMYALGVGKRFFIDSLPGQGENENKTIMKRNKNEILIAAADSRNYESGLFVCFFLLAVGAGLAAVFDSISFQFFFNFTSDGTRITPHRERIGG